MRCPLSAASEPHRLPACAITVCSRKTAQSFTDDKFVTVRRKIKTFAPKCSSEITVH